VCVCVCVWFGVGEGGHVGVHVRPFWGGEGICAGYLVGPYVL